MEHLPPNCGLILSSSPSSFLISPFFEAGTVRLGEDMPTCPSVPAAEPGVDSRARGDAQWLLSEWGHERRGGAWPSREEAFLGSNFIISRHSHHFFSTHPFQSRVATGFIFATALSGICHTGWAQACQESPGSKRPCFLCPCSTGTHCFSVNTQLLKYLSSYDPQRFL